MLVRRALLLLELDHLVEPTERAHGREEPRQLSMGRDMRLHEQGGLLRVYPTSEKGGNRLQSQLLRLRCLSAEVQLSLVL